MKFNKLFLAAIVATGVITSLTSCEKASEPDTVTGSGNSIQYLYGSLIVNEGSFGAVNGSISIYNSSTDKVSNNIFSLTNNRPLGDVVQSVNKIGNKSYICVNASNKIEVVNSANFVEEATITGITQPRYIVGSGATAYASCWGNGGEVSIINTLSNSITGTIAVGSGPEKMVIANNNLYVMNSGGYGLDSTISVININTNTVTSTITLSGYNPSAVVKGLNNNIWVLTKGRAIYDASWTVIGHDPSMLFEINTTTNTIISTTNLFATEHPSALGISPDGSTLYIGGSYGFSAIYTVNTANPSNPTNFINEANYGFFVNSSNGNIFILQEASSSNGTLLRYNPSGSKLGEYTVGIFPNGGTSKTAK